jgi:hypothetical protein
MSWPEHGGGPPHFIGVGALGSGHGWWHSLLLAHPEIEPPLGRRRGLQFFTRFCAVEMSDRDVADYHRLFPRRPGTISGEWSGRYMADAWTPPLLKRAAPDAKLLVMVSDPIERYRAVFFQRRATLLQRERLMTDVVDRRSFGAQLARLHRFFHPRQILVLQFEQCRRNPRREYRRTLEFLGVRDTSFAPRRLYGSAAGRLLARVAPALAERVTHRPAIERAQAPLWDDLEAALHTAFDPDVAALRRLVPELDVSLWPNFAGR